VSNFQFRPAVRENVGLWINLVGVPGNQISGFAALDNFSKRSSFKIFPSRKAGSSVLRITALLRSEPVAGMVLPLLKKK